MDSTDTPVAATQPSGLAGTAIVGWLLAVSMLGIGLLLSPVLPALPGPPCPWLALVWGMGPWSGLAVCLLLVPAMCLLAALACLCAVKLPVPRRLLGALACLVWAAGMWVFARPVVRANDVLRWRLLHRMGRRSEPVIRAIGRYSADHGRPPMALADLVPRYLPKYPRTGLIGYADYDHRPLGSGPYRYRLAGGQGELEVSFDPLGGYSISVTGADKVAAVPFDRAAWRRQRTAALAQGAKASVRALDNFTQVLAILGPPDNQPRADTWCLAVRCRYEIEGDEMRYQPGERYAEEPSGRRLGHWYYDHVHF